MAVGPVQGVARLEIGQAEAAQEVGAADHEKDEVEQEEEEVGPRGERGHEQNGADEEDLQASQHADPRALGRSDAGA